jgi:hypothetical protein
MMKATMPRTAIPPATDRPIIEPLPMGLDFGGELSGDDVAVAESVEDGAEFVVTTTIVAVTSETEEGPDGIDAGSDESGGGGDESGGGAELVGGREEVGGTLAEDGVLEAGGAELDVSGNELVGLVGGPVTIGVPIPVCRFLSAVHWTIKTRREK